MAADVLGLVDGVYLTVQQLGYKQELARCLENFANFENPLKYGKRQGVDDCDNCED